MSDKKYILTNETIDTGESRVEELFGETFFGNIFLFRIQAVRDFGDVKKGDKGGFVEHDENLSHSGNCWIYDNAWVYGDARVTDNARVWDDTKINTGNISGNTVLGAKYQLTDETINVCGHTLYRIKALKDFRNVKKGDKGGYVESYANLAQNGDCWVNGNAKVYGNADVYDYAQVYDNARVYGNARVFSNAKVHGDAQVYGNAQVYYDAEVWGNAKIFANAKISANARVYGDARVNGEAHVCDEDVTDDRYYNKD